MKLFIIPLMKKEYLRRKSPLIKGDLGGFVEYNSNLRERAREMRNNPTDAEKKLWNILRTGELKKHRFLRQKILGNYIADFYCSKLQLIIEVDGGGHQEIRQENYDKERTLFFENLGLIVLRFWNNEVLQNPEGVYERILEFVDGKERVF